MNHLPGANEARWVRSGPRAYSIADVERLVRVALGDRSIADIQRLRGGLRNANFKVSHCDGARSVVLRIYEHDAGLCQKELDVMRLVIGRVPVPRVVHAEPNGWDGFPPFVVMEFVEGVTFHELKRGGDREAIERAAMSIGEILAQIGQFAFAKPGWLSAGLGVSEEMVTPRFIAMCLAVPELQERVAADLRGRISDFVWLHEKQLEQLDAQRCLVHGDFGKRNVLVREEQGRWKVAAVLDWEFAVAGSPLIDIGHFLRYEHADRPVAEPHFSMGYLRGGGVLPNDWRRLSRVADLLVLCESLTHEDLRQDVVDELVGLVRSTVC